MFKEILQFIVRPRLKYQPLINVEISRQAILRNLESFRNKYPALKFAPVLKSNAYGHGLVPVAKILDNQPVTFLIVDSFFEALVLRRAAVKSPLLIIGYSTGEQIRQKKLKNVSYTIISVEMLAEISQKLTKPVTFHLKIDTGMSRQGILIDELETAARLIKNNRNIILEGVCSHLADAETTNSKLTEAQIARWKTALEFFKQNFTTIKYYHLSNTAGTFLSDEFESNVCRVGLGLYGFTLSGAAQRASPHGLCPEGADPIELEPVLALKTIISSVKRHPAGAKIGYNGAFTAPRPLTIATLPLGYNEGVDRRLSNQGTCLVAGTVCPIIGKVSMNITTIDVSNVPDARSGLTATVISNNKTDPNSVEALARLCATVPYDILVHIPAYLRRTVI